MTALQEYQRLECTGLWRDRPGAQRREVIVSFGDATLVLSESPSARALTHWSLPAIVRINPGETPARFSPDPDGVEVLELDDPAMIEAISKVHRLIVARRPHPGRLRTILFFGLLAAMIGVVAFWMPGTLSRHTAAALPFAKQQEIGRMALTDVARLTGAPCTAPEGLEALMRLHERLIGTEGELHVVPTGVKRSVTLPGGLILLSRDLVEQQPTPDVLAGEILAADLRGDLANPLTGVFGHAGLAATFRLMTTGDLPSDSLAGYGEGLLAAVPGPLPDQQLLDRFSAAEVPTSPYAYSLDPTGESVLRLIEADPLRGRAPVTPILTDADWVALQGICAG